MININDVKIGTYLLYDTPSIVDCYKVVNITKYKLYLDFVYTNYRYTDFATFEYGKRSAIDNINLFIIDENQANYYRKLAIFT